MNQICPIGTEIWFRTDKKCGWTDGRNGRTDDAKTIHSGSYMSAHVLLNFLKELKKRDKM